MLPLRAVYEAPKRLGAIPDPAWREGQNGRLDLAITIDNLSDITVRGLLFRGRTIKDRPDEEVMLQLEYPHEPHRRDKAIERIDWNPLHDHSNGATGPEDLRFVLLKRTHRHSFRLNWLEKEERMRYRNLPIAAPVPEPIPDFAALLVFVGACFNICDLERLPPPPWERTLL